MTFGVGRIRVNEKNQQVGSVLFQAWCINEGECCQPEQTESLSSSCFHQWPLALVCNHGNVYSIDIIRNLFPIVRSDFMNVGSSGLMAKVSSVRPVNLVFETYFGQNPIFCVISCTVSLLCHLFVCTNIFDIGAN